MLRKDREVKDKAEKIDILKRCDTLRIAFLDGEYPYIVPVSFGLRVEGESILLYFHGAKRGHKIELIEKSPKVCIEGDIFYKIEETTHGITTRYESVIGVGVIEKVEGDEVIEGIQEICKHYNRPAYPIGRCKGLPMTAVYKIKVESLTGKRNLSEK